MHLFLFSFVISLIRRLKAKIGLSLICSAYRPLWGGLLSKSVIYREQVGDYYAFSWFFWKDKLDSRSPNWWHSRVMTDTFINCIQVKPFSLKVAVQLTSWQMFKTSMLDLVYAMSITKICHFRNFSDIMILLWSHAYYWGHDSGVGQIDISVHIGWALICNGKESQVLFMTWR